MLGPRTAALLASALMSAAAHASEFESSDIYPADYPTVTAVAYMGKLIEEQTAGRHRIKPLGNDDLDSEGYTIAEVRMGKLAMARVDLRMLNDLVPSTVALSLPYLFESTEHLRRVLDGPIGDEILASMESMGLVGLCFYDMGARSLAYGKPVRHVRDVKGLKIRVLRSGSGGRFVEATGAVPVALTHDRISAALQARIIDGMEVTLPSFTAARHHLLTKFYSLTEHSMTPAVVIFSKKIWDELSRSDQTIIRNAAKASVPIMREQWAKHEAAARRVAEAAGVKIIDDVDKQSFADLLRPLNSRLVPDPALQAVLKRIQAER